MSRNGYGQPCKVPLRTIEFVPGVRISCHSRAAEAYQALGAVMIAHGYPVRSGDTGNYNCRNQTSANVPSAHSYGLATDVNWRTNPWSGASVNRLVTDMPKAMRDDIKRIKADGRHVFEWGGDWINVKDAMHWEIDQDAHILERGIDWDTVLRKPFDPDDPTTWITLEQGDSGPTVRILQSYLNQNEIKVRHKPVVVDGEFGALTAIGVRNFQRKRNLLVDSIVGLATWTALIHGKLTGPGESGPTKEPPIDESEEPEFDYEVAVRWDGQPDEGAARVLGKAYDWIVLHRSHPAIALINIGVGYFDGTTSEFIYGQHRDETAHMVQNMVNTDRGQKWAADVRAKGMRLGGRA